VNEPLERDIQTQIIAYLKLRDIFCWKQNTSGIYRKDRNAYIPSHTRGMPDICGILHGGRALYVEVKRKTGRLSEAQKEFLGRASTLGALAIVAYCVEDVEAALRGVS
jgi:hypothetical protein